MSDLKDFQNCLARLFATCGRARKEEAKDAIKLCEGPATDLADAIMGLPREVQDRLFKKLSDAVEIAEMGEA